MAVLALDPVPILETRDSGLLLFRDNVQHNWDKLNAIVNKLDSKNIANGSLSLADFDTAVTQFFGVGGALSGTPPAISSAGIAYKLQAGSTVLNFVGGAASFTYPVAFPNGILAIVLSNGDATAHSTAVFSTHTTGLTSTTVVATNDTGFGIVGNLRFNWIAIGW